MLHYVLLCYIKVPVLRIRHMDCCCFHWCSQLCVTRWWRRQGHLCPVSFHLSELPWFHILCLLAHSEKKKKSVSSKFTNLLFYVTVAGSDKKFILHPQHPICLLRWINTTLLNIVPYFTLTSWAKHGLDKRDNETWASFVIQQKRWPQDNIPFHCTFWYW